jgi:hypothetical protein
MKLRFMERSEHKCLAEFDPECFRDLIHAYDLVSFKLTKLCVY